MAMNDDGFVPCSPEEAVQRMLSIEGKGGQYLWGTGNYDPRDPSVPWTEKRGEYGADCAGAAICFAFRLVRHRPGFNRQPYALVEDDINVDSVLEDADPARGGRLELGEIVTVPAPGVLLVTPTIRLLGHNFCEPGHVRLIIDASRWNPSAPRWADVTYLECRGPDHRKPGVVRATGESVDHHDADWPKPLHRAAMVRIRARR